MRISDAIPLTEAQVLESLKSILHPLQSAGVLSFRRIYSGGIPYKRGTGYGIRPNTGMVGFADLLIFLLGGKVLHVELKSSTGRLRPEQKAWQLELEGLGHTYAVVRSPAELRDLLVAHGVSHWSLG